ncbi:inovirus-type Gp2 protein [Pseudomonas sp. NPDC090202]|uniref:YagK/YfjJ domain-containing protein n=1 Tax=Pseudomonas sp. NPDC090202 TaxID=3364476 RepID=UPI0037F39631
MGADETMLNDMFVAKGVSCRLNGEVIVNDELGERYRLAKCIGPLITSLLGSKHDLFSVSLTSNGVCVISSDRLGRRFVLQLELCHSSLRHEYCHYRWNPYLELFYSLVKKYHIPNIRVLVRQVRGDLASDLVDYLNNIVREIREGGSSASFKAALKSYLRPVRENYKELTSYVQSLFDAKARMLVVRVDLSYLERYRKSGSEISATQAGAHRRKLLDVLQKGGYGPLEGYAWKFEKGVRKGLHFHMLLFFDGSKVRQDVVLGRMIGELWSSVITEGAGSYYNCNAFKEKYECRGIGMVRYDDSKAMEGLDRIVTYMTKLDEYFKLSVQGVRSFGKGIMPVKPGITRGRPRVGR